MRLSIPTTVAILLAMAFLDASNTVLADYKPDCNSGWGRTTDSVSAPYKDLSFCQNQVLGFDKLNDNLIGGKGGAEIVGIPAGSDSGGCSSDNACMQMCQAMCCLQDGCRNAEVYQSKETKDYVVYKETEYRYYCRMKQSGSNSDSSRTTYCFRPNPSTAENSNCHALVASSYFKWDSTTYNYLLSLQNDNTSCTSSGRKLKSHKPPSEGNGGSGWDAGNGGSATLNWSAKEIEDKIKKAFKPFRALKKSLKTFTSARKCTALTKLELKIEDKIIKESCPSN